MFSFCFPGKLSAKIHGFIYTHIYVILHTVFCKWICHFFFGLLNMLRKAHLDLSVSYGIGLCNRLIIHWQLKRKERKIIRWEQTGELYGWLCKRTCNVILYEVLCMPSYCFSLITVLFHPLLPTPKMNFWTIIISKSLNFFFLILRGK